MSEQPRPPAGCATQGCGCLLVVCFVIPGVLLLIGMVMDVFS